MDITYQKRYDTTLVFCLAEDTPTGNLFPPLHGILGQFVFIGGNLVHPNQRNVVQSLSLIHIYSATIQKLFVEESHQHVRQQ